MNSENNAKNKRTSFLFSGQKAFSPQQNRILNIFFYTIFGATFVSLLGALLYYVFSYASLSMGNHGSDWLLGIFSDFVYIMNVSLEESPYLVEDYSSYPPVAIMVLYPFALICKGAFAQFSGSILTLDELTAAMVTQIEFWIAMVLFFLLCSTVIILAVIYEFRLPPMQSIKMGIIILCCAPFVYAVMRGNTIYFAMMFLLLFLILHKSDSPFIREVSYVCLAISGLIKIYPLFFGVFLLNKKRIFASLRVGTYFVVGFVLSFMLFEGGLNNFKHFVAHLSEFSGDTARLSAGNNLSSTSLVHKTAELFGREPAGSLAWSIVSFTVIFLIFFSATVLAIGTNSDLSRYVIASSVVILIPTVSYYYVLIFAMLPFMEFLRHYDEQPLYKKRLYFWLFMVVFFTPCIITQFFLPQTLAILTMFCVECFSVAKHDFWLDGNTPTAVTQQ